MLTQTDAPAAPEMAPEDFDALIADIVDHPERLLDPSLSTEQVLEAQKRLNPYANIIKKGERDPDEDFKRVAFCSYTNLREDYLRRLSMTSLVGFLFQMLHEWEVPVEQRRWTPASAKKKAGEASQPFAVDALVERLGATLAIAQSAQQAAREAAEAGKAAQEELLCLPDDAAPDVRAAAEGRIRAAAASEARVAGLLYAATHATNQAGLDAGNRLRATAEAGMKFPEVKEVISRFPLPAPTGQVEAPPAFAKEMIAGFLNHWFRFDPSVHVRSGSNAAAIAKAVEAVAVGQTAGVPVDAADPSHLTIDAVRLAAPVPTAEHLGAVQHILSSDRNRNAALALLRDSDLADAALAALEEPETFLRYLAPVPAASEARPAAEVVPPQDTFHRWNYYTEVNYEELRTITEALYPERVDLEWALALWDTAEGTEAEVSAAFDAYTQKHGQELPSSIKSIEFGAWSFLADFKQNRQKISFYNKNTEVLKRIIDRHAEDKKIGAELMRNRVRGVKAQNIAAEGPDAPGLGAYKRNTAEKGLDLNSKGVERVITAEEMRRLERARGDRKAAQELELLDQYEKVIAELGELEKLRTLTTDEAEQLGNARRHIAAAREMVEVPYESVQVDVWTTGKDGKTEKSHFYTKADENEEEAPKPAAPTHPVLASYALDHMREVDRRTPADMKAEALRDAKARGQA